MLNPSFPAYLLNRMSLFQCSAGGALFDGTNDWLKFGSDMVSNADGTQGTFSIWLTFTATNAVQRYIYANAEKTIQIERTAAGKFKVTLTNSTATSSLVFTGSTSYGIGGIIPSNQNFAHIAMSWDTNFSAGNKKCQMYIDGVAETLTVTDANPAFTVKYTGTQHGFMANITDGSAKWAGSVGCLYYNNQAYLDLSVPANLAKLRQVYNGNGFPAFMGSNGSAVTGSQPIVFFNNDFATFGTNLGYGGGYSVQGALTAADPTSPCLLAQSAVIVPEG